MTNRERIETFEDPYKKQFKVNLIKDRVNKKDRDNFLNSISNSHSDTITGAFIWSETKEGSTYWMNYAFKSKK